MREGPDISRLAALIGDPARAQILTALMGGQALTATELSVEAGVALPPSAYEAWFVTAAHDDVALGRVLDALPAAARAAAQSQGR